AAYRGARYCPVLMAGLWGRTRTLLDRFRENEADWVEPNNWVTRAITDGSLEHYWLRAPAAAYEFAPDNVLIAASKPYTPPEETPVDETPLPEPSADAAPEERPAASDEQDRIARAG